MARQDLILAYDFGTTSAKACLFSFKKGHPQLMRSAGADYPLYTRAAGGVEQEPDDWWAALRKTTAAVLKRGEAAHVAGIAFCSQMQGLVLVDKELRALRPAMSYLDQRAGKQMQKGIGTFPRIEGLNLFKLLRSLQVNGAVAGSVKDPLWKYKWVEDNEPALFAKVHRWLDVKDYLVARLTAETAMTADSAFATFLADTRGETQWHAGLLRMFGVNPAHMPAIAAATAKIGSITVEAARALGLKAGTPVFGGGGDASMIGIGAGAIHPGDTHIYSGTSGWVSTVTEKRRLDLNNRMASIVGARPGHYNYFAEQETSGKCLEWARDHLALDEINLFRQRKGAGNLYEFMVDALKETEPGSGGVIFTPWLHGSRSPFEDKDARGMFFNLGLDTGKRMMIRAVLEGLAFQKRWLLELADKKVQSSENIRFVGGLAQSPFFCQMLADVTGKKIQTVAHPQHAGAQGAALVAAIGSGLVGSFETAAAAIRVAEQFEPVQQAAYERNFAVFKKIYRTNRKLFSALNKDA